MLVISGRKYLAGELIQAVSGFIRLERLVRQVKGVVKKINQKKNPGRTGGEK